MAARDKRGEPAAPSTLPTGTVTLLFTDVERSTTLLRRLGAEYGEALETHRRLLRDAFARHDGHEVDTQGDAFFFVFARASDAVLAAEEAQRALTEEGWPGRVRMGLHTGEPLLGREGYVGLDVHLAARVCGAAHGGQILLTAATGDLAHGAVLRDLGLHRLRDIEQPQRIFQLGPGEFPPPRTARATNLPSPANRLIGRERELALALESLRREDVRLLTLTGPGGAGKSRLALEIAAVLGEELRDGVQLVPLAPLADATLVPSAIARVVGSREPTLSAVVDVLADSDRLLLLDNVEHVAAAAPAFAELVAGAPGVTLLTTSRSPLRVLGEHVLLVPPLGDDDAAVLFTERAAAAGYAPSPSSAPAVRELCRRLDHLPLAIELAAARVPLLGVEMLLERLSLALLSGGPRDLPERQRTLRSTIDWSYGLLTPAQRLLHQCLAVFPGGCTLVAAEEMCEIGDLVGELGVLLDGSLLLRDDDRRGGPRIRQLETVREYAVDIARETGVLDDLRRRQAGWVLGLAEEADEGLGGPHQADWLERLEVELPNLRAAIGWALDTGEEELALRITSALGRFWRAHGHAAEARTWLEQGLAATDVPDDVRADALWTAAWLAIGTGRPRFRRPESGGGPRALRPLREHAPGGLRALRACKRRASPRRRGSGRGAGHGGTRDSTAARRRAHDLRSGERAGVHPLGAGRLRSALVRCSKRRSRCGDRWTTRCSSRTRRTTSASRRSTRASSSVPPRRWRRHSRLRERQATATTPRIRSACSARSRFWTGSRSRAEPLLARASSCSRRSAMPAHSPSASTHSRRRSGRGPGGRGGDARDGSCGAARRRTATALGGRYRRRRSHRRLARSRFVTTGGRRR